MTVDDDLRHNCRQIARFIGTVAAMIGWPMVAAKACGFVDWSWWIVSAPFWVTASVLVSMIFAAVLHVAVDPAYDDDDGEEWNG